MWIEFLLMITLLTIPSGFHSKKKKNEIFKFLWKVDLILNYCMMLVGNFRAGIVEWLCIEKRWSLEAVIRYMSILIWNGLLRPRQTLLCKFVYCFLYIFSNSLPLLILNLWFDLLCFISIPWKVFLLQFLVVTHHNTPAKIRQSCPSLHRSPSNPLTIPPPSIL
jgi:hypothetical protein